MLVNAQHPISGRGHPALSPALGAEDILLEKTAAALLAECVRAAGAAGEVVPVSGWRPRAQQQSIWNDTMEKEGEAFTKQFVAKPGCSEHETGLAIDLARAARNIDFIRPHLPYDARAAGSAHWRQNMALFSATAQRKRLSPALRASMAFPLCGGTACTAD